MAELSKGKTFSSGDSVTASDLNALVDDATVVAGAITSAKLGDGAVTNTKVGAAAAIDFSKLATLTSGNILVGNSSNAVTSVAMSGDATIDNAGAVTIAASALSAAIPTGTVAMWATSSAPSGWLLCDGSTFDASTYSDLDTVLGGNTLPNLQGKVPVGVSSSDSDFDLLDTGGSKTHTLTEAELPEHEHTFSASGNSGSVPTTVYSNNTAQGGTASATANTSTAGSGTAHENMPPYIALNFIIKT